MSSSAGSSRLQWIRSSTSTVTALAKLIVSQNNNIKSRIVRKRFVGNKEDM